MEKAEGSDNSEKSEKNSVQSEKKIWKRPEKRPTGLKLLENYPKLSRRLTTTGTQAIPKPSTVLPDSRPPGCTIAGRTIPVNKDGHRLDILREKPSPEFFNAYNERKEKQKVCNSYHLAGRCEKGQECEFDHGELYGPALYTLKYILLKSQCPEGGACRDPTCFVGHVCQVDDCKGGSGCRFKLDKHINNLDFECVNWVKGEGPHAPDSPSAAVSPVADNSSDTVLVQGSTPGIPGPANVAGPVRYILDEDI